MSMLLGEFSKVPRVRYHLDAEYLVLLPVSAPRAAVPFLLRSVTLQGRKLDSNLELIKLWMSFSQPCLSMISGNAQTGHGGARLLFQLLGSRDSGINSLRLTLATH